MHLLKVQDAASAPEVAEMTLPGNLAPVNTWKYSVISPYAEPKGNVRSWVHYLNKVSCLHYLLKNLFNKRFSMKYYPNVLFLNI